MNDEELVKAWTSGDPKDKIACARQLRHEKGLSLQAANEYMLSLVARRTQPTTASPLDDAVMQRAVDDFIAFDEHTRAMILLCRDRQELNLSAPIEDDPALVWITLATIINGLSALIDYGYNPTPLLRLAIQQFREMSFDPKTGEKRHPLQSGALQEQLRAAMKNSLLRDSIVKLL